MDRRAGLGVRVCPCCDSIGVADVYSFNKDGSPRTDAEWRYGMQGNKKVAAPLASHLGSIVEEEEEEEEEEDEETSDPNESQAARDRCSHPVWCALR